MNILLFLLGLVLIAGSVFLYLKSRKLSKEGVHMDAEIVDVKMKKQTDTDSEGYTSTSKMYYPVYRYTYEGKEYIKESNVGVSNKRKYSKGDMIAILFMADSPEKAKVKGFFSQYLFSALLLVIGIMLIIGSFAA
jgi:hypothetical protein